MHNHDIAPNCPLSSKWKCKKDNLILIFFKVAENETVSYWLRYNCWYVNDYNCYCVNCIIYYHYFYP